MHSPLERLSLEVYHIFNLRGGSTYRPLRECRDGASAITLPVLELAKWPGLANCRNREFLISPGATCPRESSKAGYICGETFGSYARRPQSCPHVLYYKTPPDSTAVLLGVLHILPRITADCLAVNQPPPLWAPDQNRQCLCQSCRKLRYSWQLGYSGCPCHCTHWRFVRWEE